MATSSPLATENAASSAWQSKVLCRYFLHGVCKNGSNCLYSHDKGSKPSSICRFYLKGSCSYGATCRYDHVKPKKENGDEINNLSKPTNAKYTEKDNKNMVVLTKKGNFKTSSPKHPPNWIEASEFVPGMRHKCNAVPSSYSNAVNPESSAGDENETNVSLCHPDSSLLCPYLLHGACPYEDACEYIHGNFCDLCGKHALHPTDKTQQEKHTAECIQEIEKDMEHSFAVAKSQDKACGICMDTVMEKNPPSERRFGILSNCNHCYCLSCIRKWRGAKQFETGIVRTCPECRVKSDFVTPSKYWVDTEEEKGQLISEYKSALSVKSCKYFKEGKGECPFNNKCFYKHALPDGTEVQVKPRRKRQNAEGELDLMQRIHLWDFLEERENSFPGPSDLDTLLFALLFADSDFDSDDSDVDFLF